MAHTMNRPLPTKEQRQMEACTFELRVEPDDTPYVGNCSAWDPETDRKAEQWIRDELESGNVWAWCQVEVVCTFEGFSGEDHLCGCSYESEESFREDGGYFDDMKVEAFYVLADRLESAGADVEAWEAI